MGKKTIMIVIALLLITMMAYAQESPKNRVLGIERQTWIDTIKELKIEFSQEFLDDIAKNEKTLKIRWNTENFQKLGANTRRDNPLFKKKRRYRYMASTDLSKTDFARVIGFLPEMKEKLSEDRVAGYLPYIALCLNEGMRFTDIEFYIRRDADSPSDIAYERLYRELKFFVENREFVH